MRKTRSSSVADLAPVGKRSLRSAHNDQFYEIPTKFKFKNKTPRHEPKPPEKFTPTRRSLRLSGDDIEFTDLGSRTRNRRLHSAPQVANNNCTKGPKIGSMPRVLKREGQSFESPVQNGICSRTRQRNGKREIMGDDPAPIKSPPSLSCVETPKRTRFAPRSKRLSIAEKSSPTEVKWTMPVAELKQNLVNGDRDLNKDVDKTKTLAKPIKESLRTCSCDSYVNSRHSTVDRMVCKHCGKFLRRRKNGFLSNGTLDGITSDLCNLQSDVRGPVVFSSSNNCNDSAAANKYATKQRSERSDGDSSVHLSEPEDAQELRQDPEKRVEKQQESAGDPESSTPDESRTADKQLDDNASSPVAHIPSSENVVENTDGQKSEEKTLVNGDSSRQDLVNSSLLIDEFGCVNLDFLSEGDDDCSSYARKKRKMNLRSSGVRCDPDFYRLSLGLMIKRPRHYRLSCDVVDGKAVEEKKDADSVEFNPAENLQTESVPRPIESPTSPPIENTESKTDDGISDDKEKEAPTPNATSPCFSSLPRQSTPRKIHPRSKAARLLKASQVANEKLEKSPTIKMITKDPDEPPPLFSEEPPHGSDVYYFESDHVALKHNKDYHRLLSTVFVLESQRYQCLDDIKTLEAKREEALRAPVAFAEKLQEKVSMNFPNQQDVPWLPDVDWSKYSSMYGTFDHVFSREEDSQKKPVTRKVKINFETGVPLQPTGKPLKNKDAGETIRSETFRVAWSVEEQRKLEDLLLKYPSEEIVFNRYRKIAAELENRTPLQVQSRCQKYFIKLAKAGLPVPGHMPRLFRHKDPGSLNRLKRAKTHPQQHLAKISTFFPTFHCPVKMGDGEGRSTMNEDEDNGWTFEQDQISDEEDVPEDMRFSDEYLEVLRLKRIRREKLRVFDKDGQQALAQHIGYECDMCNCDPIQGVRYHCIDCPTEECIDLCQSCIRWQGQFETERHKATHRMEPVYKAENFVDDDYMKFVNRSGEYNYLDPNFLPPAT